MAPKPDQISSICRRKLQLTDTVCLANKLAIFQMSSDQYPDYFMAQSCLHIVINYLYGHLKLTKICRCQIPQNSGKT